MQLVLHLLGNKILQFGIKGLRLGSAQKIGERVQILVYLKNLTVF